MIRVVHQFIGHCPTYPFKTLIEMLKLLRWVKNLKNIHKNIKSFCYQPMKCFSQFMQVTVRPRVNLRRQWPKNLYTSTMMIHKSTPLCRLQLAVKMFGHLTKSTYQSKVNKKSQGLLSQRIRLWGLV